MVEVKHNWEQILLEPIRNVSDEYRSPRAYKDGGFPLDDQEIINKYRNAFKMVISQVGRQIISGKFNLANTSFPISAMTPKSIV